MEIVVKLNNINKAKEKEKEKFKEINLNNVDLLKINNINRKDKNKKKKMVNYMTSHSTGKRKHISSHNLTKNEKHNLKQSMENYYNRIIHNIPYERNNLNLVKQYKTKGNLTKKKNKTNNSCQKNRNTSFEKIGLLTRKTKYEEYQNNKNNNKSFELRNNNNKF